MDIFHSLSEAAGRLGPAAVAIGNFDGAHLGHQALFAQAKADARALGGRSVALTFDPHPGRVLNPELAPRLLTTPARKLELLREHGLDAVLVQTFDAHFADLPAERFAGDYLVSGLGARAVTVGPDFSFGRGRAGNIATLREWLTPREVTLTIVPKVLIDSLPVSSTRIRELVLEGRMGAAATLLGRPYDIDGVVVTGDGRGRTLGWPTANVAPQNELLPATGVYAARASGSFGVLPAAVNLGRKPTFGEGKPLAVEVHLIGYDGPSLIGTALRVTFLERLRAEMRFPSVDALKAQIGQDVAAAARIAG